MCMCNILQQVARVSGSKQVRQHVRAALYYVNTWLKHAGGKDCPSFSNYVFHKLCYDTVNEHGKVGGVELAGLSFYRGEHSAMWPSRKVTLAFINSV